jgi:hypothetical protein
MCVCIELLRNTASTQLIRHKKFTFASKEFVLNFVGMQLERPLSLMSFYCHILFSFCFCSRSSSSLFLSFSPVYICLSPSHAFFFSWKETKRNSQVEHAERLRGEGGEGGGAVGKDSTDARAIQISPNRRKTTKESKVRHHQLIDFSKPLPAPELSNLIKL